MISHGESMEKVRVKTADLIQKLEVNFNRHKDDLQESKELYAKKARKLLSGKIKMLKEGKVVSLRFDISPPDDHTEDYERAIEMLRMCQDETIHITSSQFAAYVQDRWTWKDSFNLQKMSYSG